MAWACPLQASNRCVSCVHGVQYAIEQLQQQLQDSAQVHDDIKAEARQVMLQPPPPNPTQLGVL